MAYVYCLPQYKLGVLFHFVSPDGLPTVYCTFYLLNVLFSPVRNAYCLTLLRMTLYLLLHVLSATYCTYCLLSDLVPHEGIRVGP